MAGKSGNRGAGDGADGSAIRLCDDVKSGYDGDDDGELLDAGGEMPDPMSAWPEEEADGHGELSTVSPKFASPELAGIRAYLLRDPSTVRPAMDAIYAQYVTDSERAN
jgi:hypothetical protein